MCEKCGNHRWRLTYGTGDEVHAQRQKTGNCDCIVYGMCRCGHLWRWVLFIDDNHR
jgi:hypothetical protein